MSYIGPAPTSGFISNAKERYTGITTAYVDLNHSISSLADVIVWVNYVKQDATNLTLTSSTRITLGATLVSADIVEVAYLGKAVSTQAPATNSVTNAMMTDDSVGVAELSATGTASSSVFLRGDNAWASAGGNNTPSFCAYASATQNIDHATTTKITLGGEEIDSDGKFATSRFTPTVAGTYFIIATLGTNDAELDRTECHIYMNGTSVTKSSCGGSGSAQLDNMTVTNSCLITLDTDDYIELYAYAETTDSSTIAIANDSGGASRIRTGLMGFKLI